MRTDIVRVPLESLRAYTSRSMRATSARSASAAARCARIRPMPSPSAACSTGGACERPQRRRVGHDLLLDGRFEAAGECIAAHREHGVPELQHADQAGCGCRRCGAFSAASTGHAAASGADASARAWRTPVRTSGFGVDGHIALVRMRMHRALGAAEQAARLVRSEVGNDLAARHELVGNAFEAVHVHHRRHHFSVHRERHVDAVALDQGRPVLVAQRVTQLDAGAQRDLGRNSRQTVEMNDHHIAEADPCDDGAGRLLVPEQHVAVA